MNLPFLRIALMIARGSFVAPVERAVNRTAAKTGIWIAFGAIAFLFVVIVHFSYELSRLEDRTRTLAEELALLRAETQEPDPEP